MVNEIISFEDVGPYIFQKYKYLNPCPANATHNFKWVKITHICLFRDLSFASPYV